MMSSGSCRLGRGCQSVHLLRIHTAPFRPTCRTLDRSRKPCGAVNPVQAFKVDEENRDTVYQGVYGPWKIEDRDRAEVWIYRAGITVVAAAFAAGTAHTLLAPASAAPPTGTDLDTILAVLGTSGLGVSLALIHIYVMQLKRLLQAFWVAGVMGGTYLLVTQDQVSLPAYVFDHPSSVWFIGPVFAALTGLTFKEGVCYGKAEAFALTLLIPALLLGHLTGWVPESVEEGLAVGVAALLVVFAGRKYTQPVKDDIGDGSVFAFQKLSPEGQAALVKKLREEGEVLR